MKWLTARAAAFPPWVPDLALAVVLAVVNVAVLLPYGSQLTASGPGVPAVVRAHPEAVAGVLVVAQVLPLAARRYWPAAVFLAVGYPRQLYDHWGLGFAPLVLGPAIAYYTVMARCSTGTRVAISTVTVVGVIATQTSPGHNEPYDFFVALLELAAAGMAGLLSRTRTAYLAEVEARAMRAETERDQQAALAAAGERTRIARELHDVVAHHVSLMAVQAEAAGSLLPAQPVAAARSVDIISDTARQALTELRRLLGVLRGPGEQPQAAPSPSLGDLDGVLDQVRGAGLAVDLTVEGTPAALAPGVELTAYRIVQEALTNALRHSAAARAEVRIRHEPGFVTVSVTDSGPVQPPAPPRPRSPAQSRAPAGIRVPVEVGAAAEASPATVPGPARPSSPAAGSAAARGASAGSVADPQRQPDETPPPALPAGPARPARVPGGFGLAGITERVASCGGTLTVGPTAAGGFAVTARLPAR